MACFACTGCAALRRMPRRQFGWERQCCPENGANECSCSIILQAVAVRDRLNLRAAGMCASRGTNLCHAHFLAAARLPKILQNPACPKVPKFAAIGSGTWTISQRFQLPLPSYFRFELPIRSRQTARSQRQSETPIFPAFSRKPHTTFACSSAILRAVGAVPRSCHPSPRTILLSRPCQHCGHRLCDCSSTLTARRHSQNSRHSSGRSIPQHRDRTPWFLGNHVSVSRYTKGRWTLKPRRSRLG